MCGGRINLSGPVYLVFCKIHICLCIGISSFRLVKFSSIILLKTLSGLYSWNFIPSFIPLILRFVLLTLSQNASMNFLDLAFSLIYLCFFSLLGLLSFFSHILLVMVASLDPVLFHMFTMSMIQLTCASLLFLSPFPTLEQIFIFIFFPYLIVFSCIPWRDLFISSLKVSIIF